MNTGVHVSFWIMIFSGDMPSSVIAGSYDSYSLSFLRNLHTVLCSGCINLHSHQYPHPLQHLLFVAVFDDGYSDQCEVILHCSFDLHFSNNKQCCAFFHVFIGHPYVSLEKCLFRSAHFLIGLLVFLVWSWMSYLHVLEINPLSVVLLAIIFSLWRRKWQPTPVFLPGESHGWRGLVGYSLWGCKESDMTKQLTHTHIVHNKEYLKQRDQRAYWSELKILKTSTLHIIP